MRKAVLLVAIIGVAALPLHADDGAASIAAGGIVLMKREPRITMAKEVLRIGLQRVVVDYDFRNDSDDDVETLVAFPVAPYTWEDYYWSHEEAFNELGEKPSDSRIASFRLMVNGQTTTYRTRVEALLNGLDYAPLLRSLKVDPATFGHLSEEDGKSDFGALTTRQMERLRNAGLISKDQAPTPRWKVELRYYWSQRFPAHQIVHIRHEYKPISGEQQSPPEFLPGGKPEQPAADADIIHATRRMLASTCVSDKKLGQIERQIASRPHREFEPGSKEDIAEYFRHMLVVDWVDFILTTANTWKQPIGDFTLIMDTTSRDADSKTRAFFCGDGPLSPGSGVENTYHAKDFIPTHELRVGFFHY